MSSFDFSQQESESIEYKETLAEKEDAGEALVAFANKDGGRLYFGVKNNGTLVGLGTVGDSNLKTLAQLYTDNTEPKIYPIINIEEQNGKKLICIEIAKSPTPYHVYKSKAYVRVGTTNRQMDQEELHRRWMDTNNNTYDFSAEICEGLSLDDLDVESLKKLQDYWANKEQSDEFREFSTEDVLKKLLLLREGKFTYASLLLCGKEEKIAQYLPEAEIRFAWKADPTKLDFDFTKDWRKPFINIFEDIWDAIDARNTRFAFEQGFLEGDIWAFNKKSVREAILNAFAHRNYEERGSIFIETTSQSFMIKSPGKFLPGVSIENILDVQGKWRNRLLMEVLAKVGLVERYGHGLDRIFISTISEGKGQPRIEETTSNCVELTIPTQVKDEKFVSFLEKISQETQVQLDFVKDLIFLDEIYGKHSSNDAARKIKFLQLGIIEKVGKGRGMKYLLSQRFYSFLRQKGEYTRIRWLSKDQQKETLWNFFKQYKKGQMKDFREDIFENRLSNKQILQLLTVLRGENKIYFEGPQRSPKAYWKIKE